MNLRILCLHGQGASASIFESQTANLRSLLPGNHVFVFVDGSVPCEAGANLGHIFPGPYRCWYTSPSTGRVIAAHNQLRELIRTKGPFDVVMGFSQGAAVAASFLLHERIESPAKPSAFKAGIFICSPVPFSTSTEHGIDARKYFGIDTTQPLQTTGQAKFPDHLITDQAYLNGEAETSADGGPETARAPFYQMFHATNDACRIKIPCLNIYGKRDQWRLHSIDLAALCKPTNAYHLEHDGGHEIPLASTEDMADAVEELLFKAQ